MPQLDFLIILPQIFWLIFSFSFFYFILTYYLLPCFLKTIKARINFIKNNQIAESQLTFLILEKKQINLKKLIKLLNEIHLILFSNLFHSNFIFSKKPFKKNYLILNRKIISAAAYSIFFCNSTLLNTLKFYPLFLNRKKL
uniref:ATP synthase F0 subunit 8 n=1 Tax=Pterosiphonia complanata TaxID=884089 RepID=UPI0022FD81D6|nr:ATP synthase F0 subunit 8 [Pterosiphonia complanata]WAX04105.1 ATP synthase F0 subunit 8 [Pterosiphonia complanata]